MSIRSRLLRPFDRTDVAFIIVVIAAYATIAASAPSTLAFPSGLVLLAAGIAYLLIGLYGCDWLCRSVPHWQARAIQLAIEIPLGTLILFLSHGSAWLILFPIASQTVPLPRPWMLAFCAAIVLASAVGSGGLRSWPEFVQTILSFLAGVVFVVAFTEVAVREERARAEVERLAAELSDANRKLREYALQAEELAITKERNRIAREIHDSLGHYLTTIHMQIQAALAVIDSDRARSVDALNKAQALSRDGLAEVRQSVAALRDSPLHNRSLPDAVAELADECRSAGIVTDLAVCGTPRSLSPQAELTLYRALQEGLTNLRKHAHASRAQLTLDYSQPASVSLKMEDNGVGKEGGEGGFGLLGMRERVQLLNGRMKTSSAPGQGFTLEVELPG